MPITVTCGCGKTLQVADEFAGREGQCPYCSRALRIPGEPDAHITEQAPLPKPSKKKENAPWLDPPRHDPLPPDPREDEEVGQLTTHAGTFISEGDDFFVDAPKEIGRLLTASTSLRKDQEPKTPAYRAVLSLVLFFVGFILTEVVIYMAVEGRFKEESILLALILPTAVGGIIAGIVVWATRFSHTCSYVGTKGVAVYQCSGDRDGVSRTHFFLFRDAAELRIGQTRHYYNGVYTGTDYGFTWSNERGDTVFQYGGRYRSEAGTPEPKDPYHFALMAETAWTMHLFRDIEDVIKNDGSLYFGLRGGDFIELADGLFILSQGGTKTRLHADQIDKMTIGNGVISIWEVGAQEGWFINKGIHQFMYADLGNARFFLYALEKLVGIRF
jgi:hypothetical protein